jgi:hypothetical protein
MSKNPPFSAQFPHRRCVQEREILGDGLKMRWFTTALSSVLSNLSQTIIHEHFSSSRLARNGPKTIPCFPLHEGQRRQASIVMADFRT